MSPLFSPLSFTHGPDMKNRFMLAPLTNSQSHEDGTLGDDEFHWLTKRAEGGFGLTMTCAAHVQANGQGFPGQLGIFDDKHLVGLARLAADIKSKGSLAIVQLHHAGMRSPKDLIGETPVCPSVNEEFKARELSATEVEELINDFVEGAVRAEKSGFQGIELHGAHGYILGQFLSAEINLRQDQYGGSLENRTRPIDDIITGIRKRCSNEFIIGLRLSPERFGMQLSEILEYSQQLMSADSIDFLDMSLWDVFKEPVEEAYQGRSLLSYFTELDRNNVRLGVAGKIMTGDEAQRMLDEGVDWVMLGRAAILHHDFPKQLAQNAKFSSTSLPVSHAYLANEGLSPTFIEYMKVWRGFVAE
ncbi:MAG: NADH:flavin oxidoreductase [Pseudomonadales bacterium]|nr:NADH:flavin oxidoreductase [Pseudomonadales bacterium]